ncbi:MAG TPA: glycosyltransferase [Candidatus Dormibacteraeota bacterium]|jgi:glycosyltransferase involved in cell wall biosynthesis|nr:glycosyltransferase [Candidatus Dormibacteraeota bacterium]
MKRRLSVLVLSQHPYDHVTLRRNSETLLRAGMFVDEVCMTDRWELGKVHQTGLRRYGIPLRHRRTLIGYLLEYVGFLAWSFLVAGWLGLRRRYDAVQVDTLPDVLVFSALVPRIRGARILLYVYDLMPEMVASKLRCGPRHALVRIAAWMESSATSWADQVITVSDLFKRVMATRGLDGGKVTLVANSHPVEEVPYRPPASPPWLVCQTSLIERYGVQVAIRAVAELKDRRPELLLKVLGEGEQQPELERLAESLGVRDRVYFSGRWLPWSEAMQLVRQGSVGIVPIISDGYGDMILPNKVLELAALDVPIASSDLRGIAEHFPADTISYFPPGDHVALAERIDYLLDHAEEAGEQAERAKAVMELLSWRNASRHYLSAIRNNPAGMETPPAGADAFETT